MADPQDFLVETILRETRTIAVAIHSDRPVRDSHAVADYLRRAGYRVIPVHPGRERIAGERCHPDVRSIPEPVDLVDVFRRSSEVGPIVDDAIAKGVRWIWMQLGVVNEEAEARARAAGIGVVTNRCIRTDHMTWRGRSHGVPSSETPRRSPTQS